jgi:uncharacterized membrane protein
MPLSRPPSSSTASSPDSRAASTAEPSATVAVEAATAAPTPELALTRYLAVGSLIGLIVLSLAWELWLAPLRPGGSLLALKALPLCLPLAGLLKRRLYTYRWVSLLVWLYFTEGVVRAYSDTWPSQGWAGLEVLLCLTLFSACALHVRWRFRHAAALAAAGTTASGSNPPARVAP